MRPCRIRAILDNEPLTCNPDDAYEAPKIATALQYSFRNGVPVYFDNNGLPSVQPQVRRTSARRALPGAREVADWYLQLCPVR